MHTKAGRSRSGVRVRSAVCVYGCASVHVHVLLRAIMRVGVLGELASMYNINALGLEKIIAHVEYM